MKTLIIQLLATVLFGSVEKGLHGSAVSATKDDCVNSLGLESGHIQSSQITSSTSRSPLTKFGPQHARLYSAHAWCAAENTAGQYIQIDLGVVTMVTYVVLQGSPSADEFVTSFFVMYGINDGHWVNYTENGQTKVFQGNTNCVTTVARRQLKTATAARYIRIHPVTWYGHVCMRLELKGCDADPLHALGMFDGTIADSAITSSSSYLAGYPPFNGRLLRTKLGPGQVWIPKTHDTSQWIQVALGTMRFVSAVAVQGRPWSTNYVKRYQLTHSRDDVVWSDYTVNGVVRELSASFSREKVMTRFLEPAIYASFVRFHPKQWWSNTIAMRVELYKYGKHSPGDLGIANGEIPDTQLKASSHFTNNYAKHGRLHSQVSGTSHGWCPSSNGNSWLEFDLGHVMMVTGIVTQPRGFYTYIRWITQYEITTSLDNSMWTAIKDPGSDTKKRFTVIQPNEYAAVTKYLDTAVVARRVRIYPKKWTERILCFRASLVGHKKAVHCQKGWIPFRDHCYYFHVNNTAKLSVNQARADCQGRGGYLTDIKDNQEFEFISRHLDIRFSGGHKIGLNDEDKEGVWRWLDGTVSSWKPWRISTGQPNGGTGENCVAIKTTGYVIIDISCSHFLTDSHICKKRSPQGFFGTPVIYPDIPDIELYENEAVTLQCQATGDPVIHIAWLHNGQVVQNNTDSAYRNERVPLNMSGSWRCVASNHIGMDAKTFHVQVKNRPQHDRLFVKQPQFSMAPQGHVIDQVAEVADHIRCLQICIACSACRSYSHNPSLGLCEIYNTSHMIGDLDYREGYSYFTQTELMVIDLD